MKALLLRLCLSIAFILLFFTGCSDDDKNNNPVGPAGELSAEPVVKSTTTNYTEAAFRTLFPEYATLSSFGNAYNGKYSDALKSAIISNIDAKAAALGLNTAILDSCISATGCMRSGEVALPSYVEKARYSGKDAWLIQIVWGTSASDFGHYKCYAIDSATLDTLDFIRCK